MRRTFVTALLALIATTGCSSPSTPQPAPAPAAKPAAASQPPKCIVHNGTASCSGHWNELDKLQAPEAVTRIAFTAPAGPQPDFRKFPKLDSLVLDSAPLDITKLPSTITTVAVIGNSLIQVDPNRALEHFYLVRDQSAVELFATQPAAKITGRLNAKAIDLTPLNNILAHHIKMSVSHQQLPKVKLPGLKQSAGSRATQSFKNPFAKAKTSTLTITGGGEPGA